MSKKGKNKNKKFLEYIVSITLLICSVTIGYISQNTQNLNKNNTENIITN